MKKTFAVLVLMSFLTILVLPLFSASAEVADCCKVRRAFKFEDKTYNTNTCYGATAIACPACNNSSATADENWGMVCLLNTIYRVADLAFAVLVAFAILMILLAAYTFITAGGAPEKVNKARDYILYALVGLIVAFLARAIPSLVQMVV